MIVFVCREVWQTEKAFGYEDIGAEEEFNLLREIFMTSKMDSKGICLFNLINIFMMI
jgi:hypothetical protein